MRKEKEEGQNHNECFLKAQRRFSVQYMKREEIFCCTDDVCYVKAVSHFFLCVQSTAFVNGALCAENSIAHVV